MSFTGNQPVPDNRNLNCGNVPIFSSNWTNSSNTSTFYLNVNNSPGNSNSNIGTHLTLWDKVIKVTLVALALAKTHNDNRTPC